MIHQPHASSPMLAYVTLTVTNALWKKSFNPKHASHDVCRKVVSFAYVIRLPLLQIVWNHSLAVLSGLKVFASKKNSLKRTLSKYICSMHVSIKKHDKTSVCVWGGGDKGHLSNSGDSNTCADADGGGMGSEPPLP